MRDRWIYYILRKTKVWELVGRDRWCLGLLFLPCELISAESSLLFGFLGRLLNIISCQFTGFGQECRARDKFHWVLVVFFLFLIFIVGRFRVLLFLEASFWPKRELAKWDDRRGPIFQILRVSNLKHEITRWLFVIMLIVVDSDRAVSLVLSRRPWVFILLQYYV